MHQDVHNNALNTGETYVAYKINEVAFLQLNWVQRRLLAKRIFWPFFNRSIHIILASSPAPNCLKFQRTTLKSWE
jgi:hypothetical protein